MDKEWEWSFAKTKDWVQSSWLSRDIKISRPLFLTCCVAAFLLGYAATALLVTYPTKDGGHIAAWVQAFGSIGAIVGAVYIMKKSEFLRRGHERDIERRRFDHHIEVLRHSAETVPNSLEELNKIYNQIHSPDQRFSIRYYGSYGQYVAKPPKSPISTISNTFDVPVWALKKIDIHIHPYIFLAHSTGQLIQLMENAKKHFQTEPYSSGFIDSSNIDMLMDYLEDLSENCEVELKRAEDIYKEKKSDITKSH